MSPRRRAQALAMAGALAVFLLLLLALRLRAWLPFVGAALAYLAILWALRPRSGGPEGEPPSEIAPEPPMPDGVAREDWRGALAALDEARQNLAALAAAAPAADRPLVERMAERVAAIRRHHTANPAHVPRTRGFLRRTLPRMVEAVAGYIDLARRAGQLGDDPERARRLDEVARRLGGFLPVLERIERACLENDLTALEIGVEVLDDQLRPGGSLGEGGP